MNPSRPPATPRPPRRWRAVDGIVLLDKPAGISSNDALQRVRRALRAEKAGHAGTLDPMATGMLPLCFGQATKACGSLLGQRKAYRATVALGAATDTGDAEGQVVDRRDVCALDPGRIEAALAPLRGDRLQVPPMYSALKRDGRPLYELARRGEQVEREARPVRLDSLELQAFTPDTLEIEVVCSKGTYVRVLGEEIAAGLGTVGHLTSLRRLWVEPFGSEAMVTLDRVEQDCAPAAVETSDPSGTEGWPAWLQPTDIAFRGLPEVRLDDAQALHLRQGRSLTVPGPWAEDTTLRAYDAAGGFLGLVDAGPDGLLRARRLFVAGAGT